MNPTGLTQKKYAGIEGTVPLMRYLPCGKHMNT